METSLLYYPKMANHSKIKEILYSEYLQYSSLPLGAIKNLTANFYFIKFEIELP